MATLNLKDAIVVGEQPRVPAKKPISWENIALGAFIQVWEVSTLGQVFEVMKTHMAANRGDNLIQACKAIHARGGLPAFYQGLIPWAWIEASTKGGVLLFSSSEIEYRVQRAGLSKEMAGLLGGMGGGVCQAYLGMGVCTFMKTVEVTRKKSAGQPKSTFQVAAEVWKREGIRGLNKGVSAVALRQMTNWGSRFGISRLTESLMKGSDKDRKLSTKERIASSVIGGALACWNQPIEVIRVEMQSQLKNPNRPANPNIFNTAKYIYENSGLTGFYRGVTPRIALGVYLTVCMVFGGDQLKAKFAEWQAAKKMALPNVPVENQATRATV